MKSLRKFSVPFSLAGLQREHAIFERFLLRKDSFDETIVLRLFRNRHGLLRLLAGCFPEVSQHPVLYASELSLAGEFRADFAVGNSRYRALALVEFESGDNTGLLLPSKLRTLSNRAAHGLSQLFAWDELLNDLGQTEFVKRAFTFFPDTVSFMYVGGRSTSLTPANLKFSRWLQTGISLSDRAITIVTFDALREEMQAHLEGLALTGR